MSDRKRKREATASRQGRRAADGSRAKRVIIVGGGHIGFSLAKALAPRHSVFVIDHDPAVADAFAKLDVQFIQGSATSAKVLRRAEPDEADIFISCTGLDEVNIVACSLARSLGDMRTVCFVSKEDLLRFAGTPDGRTSASTRSSGRRRSSPMTSNGSSPCRAPSMPRPLPMAGSSSSSTACRPARR